MKQWLDSLIMLDNLHFMYDTSPKHMAGFLGKQTVGEIKRAVSEARVYELDGRIGRLFALTPNKPRDIELPFPMLFLDIKIEYKSYTYNGILLLKAKEAGMTDVLIQSVYNKELDEKDSEVGIVHCYLNKDSDTDNQPTKSFVGGDIVKILRRIVMNFNDFLEHPEVKVALHSRTNQDKRAKRGKIPLPSSNQIVVKGELKIYLDSIQPKPGENDSLDNCFEVAGHWRRFRHPRFTNKQGEKTFIHPYIKGTGTPRIKRRKIPQTKLIDRVEAI